jgi:hypothetical protein
MKKFFEIMIWIDDEISHPIWDFLDEKYNPENNTYFYSNIFCDFCQFAWKGWHRTHPEKS